MPTALCGKCAEDFSDGDDLDDDGEHGKQNNFGDNNVLDNARLWATSWLDATGE